MGGESWYAIKKLFNPPFLIFKVRHPAVTGIYCIVRDSRSGRSNDFKYLSYYRCILIVLFASYPGATISIQETEINIEETTSSQVCIVLENSAGGLERDVSVTLTTTARTAGKYNS